MYDGRCGSNNRLPDNSPAECDPDGENPCCSSYGRCGNTDNHCSCSDCVDYSIVSELRKSGENCTVTTEDGFLKNVCFNETKKRHYFKCAHSEVYFGHEDSNFKFQFDRVTSVCENDPHVYQACGFNTKITNSDVLCGGLFCDNKYIKCDKNCSVDKDCSISQSSDVSTAEVCDDKCDDTWGECIDESNCNGYKYGINCRSHGRNRYFPAKEICDGLKYCDKGEDEQDCNVTESTPHTCTHYRNKVRRNMMRTVPILNYTRCSVVDLKRHIYPYCLNYLDQTNCSDVERVGGYCDIDGYNSSVSKYMVCFDYNHTLNSNNSVTEWRRVLTVQRMRFVGSLEIYQRSIRPLFITKDCEMYAVKSLLTEFVTSIPDEPPVTGYCCQNGNSLLNWSAEKTATSLHGWSAVLMTR